ncbi:D-tyrosyl-tRNA(Tyr) deacylase [Gammaproteobacteria bacterium 45_16_T64]|nr:D-tyrosyl-tRNA(Tyr) deacylase [Gammaproteobacteria bacterium 45_16_T64]
MKALIQRVAEASVVVDQKIVGQIGQGLLVLLGVEHKDDEAIADKLLKKIINYRVFSDEEGKMNNSLVNTGGGLLLVSQFTLAADTNKGLRPSFSSAAEPQQAEGLYDYMLGQARECLPLVGAGVFAADMKVQLLNDGPVTFMLEV